MNTAIANIEHWHHLLVLAAQGDGRLQYEIGLYLETGYFIGKTEIVKANGAEALAWFFKAYENGNMNATIKVADYFRDGIHCGKDIGLAMEFYKKAMDSGSSIAARKLAGIHRLNEDFEEAQDIEQKAQELAAAEAKD